MDAFEGEGTLDGTARIYSRRPVAQVPTTNSTGSRWISTCPEPMMDGTNDVLGKSERPDGSRRQREHLATLEIDRSDRHSGAEVLGSARPRAGYGRRHGAPIKTKLSPRPARALTAFIAASVHRDTNREGKPSGGGW